MSEQVTIEKSLRDWWSRVKAGQVGALGQRVDGQQSRVIAIADGWIEDARLQESPSQLTKFCWGDLLCDLRRELRRSRAVGWG